MSFLGIEIGPSIDSLAGDWVNQFAIKPANQTGDLPDLETSITQQTQACGNYVHQQNFTHTTGNGASVCQQKLQALYAPLIQQLQADAAANQTKETQAALAGNSQLIAIVAVVLIVMVVIVLLIKS